MAGAQWEASRRQWQAQTTATSEIKNSRHRKARVQTTRSEG